MSTGLWSLALGLRPLVFGFWFFPYRLRLVTSSSLDPRPKTKAQRPKSILTHNATPPTDRPLSRVGLGDNRPRAQQPVTTTLREPVKPDQSAKDQKAMSLRSESTAEPLATPPPTRSPPAARPRGKSRQERCDFEHRVPSGFLSRLFCSLLRRRA